MTPKPTLAFAGMTHLGLNSATAAAEKGFDVICYDANKKLTADLAQGNTTVNEPQLKELMAKNASRLRFTSQTTDLARADITYIALDVPTNDEAVSDLTPVRAMIDVVNASLRADALLVILCQVPPGFTRSINRDPTKLYYQVETLIFGKAIERAMYPERYMIGCANPATPLPDSFRTYLESYNCPILPMRYESAELAKTAINLFLAAQVSTANTLAEVCERIGADWGEIIPSLRLDKRIGQHAYLVPGLGLSGGNIERDLRTVSNLGYEHGAKASVPLAYMEHSRYRKQWSIRTFFQHADSTKPLTVALLGLAYKENTHSIKNSPSIELLEALPTNATIRAYDPVVKTLSTTKRVTHCQSAAEAIEGADVLCVMTAWDEFKTLDYKSLTARMKGTLILDPYQLIPPAMLRSNFMHCVLGREVKEAA